MTAHKTLQANPNFWAVAQMVELRLNFCRAFSEPPPAPPLNCYFDCIHSLFFFFLSPRGRVESLCLLLLHPVFPPTQLTN